VLLEKKRRVREALEEGKPIPTELRNEEHELRRLVDLDDQDRAGTFHLESICLSFCC
jgi:U3 small nucleolar ribonucleoprotein protein IMP4